MGGWVGRGDGGGGGGMSRGDQKMIDRKSPEPRLATIVEAQLSY